MIVLHPNLSWHTWYPDGHIMYVGTDVFILDQPICVSNIVRLLDNEVAIIWSWSIGILQTLGGHGKRGDRNIYDLGILRQFTVADKTGASFCRILKVESELFELRMIFENSTIAANLSLFTLLNPLENVDGVPNSYSIEITANFLSFKNVHF